MHTFLFLLFASAGMFALGVALMVWGAYRIGRDGNTEA